MNACSTRMISNKLTATMYNVLIILIIVENIEGLKFDKFGERTIVRQILACELRNNVGHEC